MSLSKPAANFLFNLLGNYIRELYMNPIRTKSLTSGTLSALANIISQRISSKKGFNQDSFIAYILFGVLFGGPVPHYFFMILQKVVPSDSSYAVVKHLIIERLIYAPLYQAFSLYTLARFEGKTHEVALDEMHSLYKTVLANNWKYLTIFQLINFGLIPQSLKVLYVNLVGFFWVIFISFKRAKAAERKSLPKPQ